MTTLWGGLVEIGVFCFFFFCLVTRPITAPSKQIIMVLLIVYNWPVISWFFSYKDFILYVFTKYHLVSTNKKDGVLKNLWFWPSLAIAIFLIFSNFILFYQNKSLFTLLKVKNFYISESVYLSGSRGPLSPPLTPAPQRQLLSTLLPLSSIWRYLPPCFLKKKKKSIVVFLGIIWLSIAIHTCSLSPFFNSYIVLLGLITFSFLRYYDYVNDIPSEAT